MSVWGVGVGLGMEGGQGCPPFIFELLLVKNVAQKACNYRYRNSNPKSNINLIDVLIKLHFRYAYLGLLHKTSCKSRTKERELRKIEPHLRIWNLQNEYWLNKTDPPDLGSPPPPHFPPPADTCMLLTPLRRYLNPYYRNPLISRLSASEYLQLSQIRSCR